jgi:hypothetical protein
VIPAPYELTLLALAAFRLFWLVGEDAIFDRPRNWLSDNGQRDYVELFLTCPWCAGFWISLGVWVAWLGLDDWAVMVAVPFAISALVGSLTMALHALSDVA